MTIQETAAAFTDLLKADMHMEAAQQFNSPDIVSIEEGDGPMSRCEGIDAVMAKGQWWYENHEVHSVEVAGPWVNGNQFSVHFAMDVTPKDGERMQMTEIGLYTVKDGKVIEERFFY